MVLAPLQLSLLTYFMEIFLIMLVNKNLFYKIIFPRLLYVGTELIAHTTGQLPTLKSVSQSVSQSPQSEFN